MRLLLTAGAFPDMPCGVGDYMRCLAAALAARGLDVHVLTKRDARVRPPDQDEGFKLHAVADAWTMGAGGAVRKVVQELRPDVINIQYPASFGQGNRSVIANAIGYIARAAAPAHACIVTTLHEYGERRRRWRARAALNILGSDGIICVNRFDMPYVAALGRGQTRPVAHIPLASSIPRVPLDVPQATALRRRLEIAPDEYVVAYFGFITPAKGFATLLDAVKLLKEEGQPVKLLSIAQFDAAGNTYHRRLAEQIKALELGAQCVISDQYLSPAEASAYFQIADLAVLPFTEGASERRSSLLAAIAHDLPIVTTSGPFLPPHFVDGENMLLAPPDSPAAIARAVRRIHEDAQLHDQLVDGVAALAAQHDWQMIAAQAEDFYCQLIHRSHKGKAG